MNGAKVYIVIFLTVSGRKYYATFSMLSLLLVNLR